MSNSTFNIEGVRQWVNEHCLENFKQTDDINIKKISTNINVEYGEAVRLAGSRILKTSLVIFTISNITTAFKISDPEIPGSEIIFGYLYTNLRKESHKTGTFTGTEHLIHELYCASASLLSRDGEYRQRINPVYSLQRIIDKFTDVWEDLEEYVMEKVKRYNWNTFTESFYPVNELKEYAEEMESDLAGRRFDVKFLVICWFVEFVNIANNIKINHINKLFLVIMRFKDKIEVEKDLKFYNQLIETHSAEKINLLHNNLNCYTHAPVVGTSRQLKLGQKIIPLNLSEVQNPFNIRYKPWREYLISEKIQSLVVNSVCSGVPLLGDYFYIRNARKTLFDNYVQYMKLEHSEQAIGIARKLIEAQRSTFKSKGFNNRTVDGKERVEKNKHDKLIETYKDSSDGPDSYNEIEEWLSNKFRLLHEKIADPIEFSREEIIMSEMAMCVTSEYVGRTFYDALNIVKDNKTYAADTGDMYENYDTWAKYMFELIYTLYCLNSLHGVIHGDLHLNNFTLHPLYFSNFKNLNDLKNPSMVYALDKNHYYAFPSKQYHIVIIDFSRSIIRPSFLDSFENFELMNAKKMKFSGKGKIQIIKPEERSEFFHEQVVRVVKFYELYFPDYIATKKSQISLLLLNNFDRLFPILGGIDSYMSVNNLILFFRKNGYDKKYIKHFKLLEDIFFTAETELTENFEKFINDSQLLSNSVSYTNKKILDQHFKEYLIISPENNQIDKYIASSTTINASIYENKEIYNLSYYDKFPEYTKTTQWYFNGKLQESPFTEQFKAHRIQYEKEKLKNLHFISDIANTYFDRIF